MLPQLSINVYTIFIHIIIISILSITTLVHGL